MTLTEFLLARIAEDEAVAESLDRGGLAFLAPTYVAGLGTVAVVGGDRLLAECEARRRIVEDYSVPKGSDLETDESTPTPFWVLKELALPYADHPDFREEWRP